MRVYNRDLTNTVRRHRPKYLQLKADRPNAILLFSDRLQSVESSMSFATSCYTRTLRVASAETDTNESNS